MGVYRGRVAKIAKVKTFTMRDLTRPDGPRTIRILSAIVNFKAFCDTDDRMGFLQRLQEKSESTQRRYDERRSELEELEHAVSEMRSVATIIYRPAYSNLECNRRLSLEEEKPAARAVQKETEKIQEEQNAQYDLARELQRQSEALKASKRELTALLVR